MKNPRSMLVATLKLASFLFCLFSYATGMASASQQAAVGETSQQKATAAQVQLVDINNADREKLATLPGVGPALAERIIAYRNENGAFKEPEGLKAVKGIGEKKFEKLRPLIKV